MNNISIVEIVERYELLGEQRYRVRVKGTNFYLNIKASSDEEALRKALELIRVLKLDNLAEKLQG